MPRAWRRSSGPGSRLPTPSRAGLQGPLSSALIRDLVQEHIKMQDIAVDQTPLYAPIKFAGHEAGEFVFQPL